MRDYGLHVLSWALFMAIGGGFYLAALHSPTAYIWMTYENLIGEWAQWGFISVGCIVSVRLVFVRWPYRWFFVLLALSCFYVAMEEISWGQQVFGWESPDFFKANNKQGETNLHNFLTGPDGGWLKDFITVALSIALAGYGLVYPLLLKLRLRPVVWMESKGLAAPPLYLWPFWVGAGIMEMSFFGFNEGEVAELLAGFAVAGTAVHYAYARGRDLECHGSSSWGQHHPTALALRQGAVVVMVIAFATITTLKMYADPQSNRRMNRRIEAGLEKFAGRYERYERWDMVVYLCQLRLDESPRSVSTLRELAEAYRGMSDPDGFEKYITRALEIDRGRFKDDPTAASVCRSLVRTYRVIGDSANAELFVQKALDVGLERIAKHPESDNANYSLARTYSLIGEEAKALPHYKKAYDLNPTKSRNRKAYNKAKRRAARRG
jgi:tetratricopeptide (TPR) repeat protein